MNWEVFYLNLHQNGPFVSKYDHCLYDVLGRFKSGELKIEIPFIVSNHMDLKPIADSFEIPFFRTSYTRKSK